MTAKQPPKQPAQNGRIVEGQATLKPTKQELAQAAQLVDEAAGRTPTPVTLIAYDFAGFEIRVHLDDIEKVEPAIDWLSRKGYQSRPGYQYTPDGSPICPKHGTPLTLREKQGDSWFSHNVGTKDSPIYCKGYRDPKSSPGWDYSPGGNG